MLQQTTVAAVGPYFMRFLKRWPTVEALAKAELEEVLQMWAGLGYYRRARNLHACAQKIVAEYEGFFPSEEKELLILPGLGAYTAAAIRAIAFDLPANVVDGNVERVVARLFNVQTPLPQAKKEIRALALTLLPSGRFGDYAQALMDLGATLCSPRSPRCELCPWVGACSARLKGMAEALPRRAPKKPKPLRRATAFVALDEKGRVFLRKRPSQGLLADMMETPSTPWEEGLAISWPKAKALAPFPAKWKLLSGLVHHTFTHFDLELSVAFAVISKPPLNVGGVWMSREKLGAAALPSVMRKVLRHGLLRRSEEKGGKR